MNIRDALPTDAQAILELNEVSVALLSPLDDQRLEHLCVEADVAWVAEAGGGVATFLLPLREGADYDSVNYRWFERAYDRFLYVDRVAVDPAAQGQGLGRGLYRRLISHAHADGVGLIVCEYDIDPPNEPSRRFHDGFGFREVGRQPVGEKVVTLQALDLNAFSTPR